MRFHRAGILAMGFSIAFLSGCATGGGGGQANLTPEQQVLRDYTKDYTMQGAIVGALGGCAIGWLASGKAEGCAAGGVAGGIAGGTAGYFLAQNQTAAGYQASGIALERERVDNSVADAQAAAAAAASIADRAEAELQELHTNVAAGVTEKAVLERRLTQARKDQDTLVKAVKKLDDHIKSAHAALENPQLDGSSKAYLFTRLQELEVARAKIKQDEERVAALILSVPMT
ncbi:hypothetical protein [Niveispirillum fermenti]|uniref:hypothetical protein n=1 Tax=Niveispirillum fermenti TaxID=1233113 RepID=UPI003A8866B9